MRLRIFVVGAPRSGTTLLQSLLASHPAITSFTESHFFSKHFKPAWPHGPIVLRHNPLKEVKRFLTENEIDLHAYDPYVASFRQLRLLPLRTSYAARLFIQLLDEIASQRESAIWLEKTPMHLYRIDLISRVTRSEGGARFIHIVRDGREVVASLYQASRKWPRSYSLDECVRRWNRDVRITLERTAFPSDHVLFYEDLVSNTEQVLRDLLGRLHLEWSSQIMTEYPRTAARVIAGGEEWKGRTTEPIGLSQSFVSTLSKSEQDYVSHALDLDLHARLQDAVRRS